MAAAAVAAAEHEKGTPKGVPFHLFCVLWKDGVWYTALLESLLKTISKKFHAIGVSLLTIFFKKDPEEMTLPAKISSSMIFASRISRAAVL